MPKEGLRQLDEITAAWKRAKEAFEESERRYRNLVEHSLGLICTHDLDGRLLSINPAAARSLGYEPEHGVGLNLATFLAPETRHLFDDYLQRMRDHRQDDGLMRVVARDGSARVWMYRNVLYEEPGGTSYVLGHALDISERVAAERILRENEQVLRDAQAELERRVKERTLALEEANEHLRVQIAERKRAEDQAQDANRLKDEFLSTLSHELRTPLNVVFGWARILKMRQLDQITAHAVDVIERNAEAQIRLIEDVLDVSRIITGKMGLSLESLNVRDVVVATIDAVRPAAQAKGVRIDVQLEDDGAAVSADRHRLQQVFGNVLSNAVKFTRANDVITVTLRSTNGWAEIQVSDTGVGIRRDVLPYVFDRFRQADSSTTRSHGGLGLGLAIVRQILELHGGTVAADSAGEGRGATFTIRLPLEGGTQASVETVPHDLSLGAELSNILLGRKVLVVEDHDDARELVTSVLGAAGAEVISATSTREALAFLNEVTPDLLLADLGLPGEDGYALLRRIRAMDSPEINAVPAVAITAYAMASDREQALAAGFERYIVKPVDPAELVNVLASVLQTRR